MTTERTPLEPVWTAPLFPSLGRELVGVLRGLSAEEWDGPTVCSAWSVRDIAAHLVDSALRRTAAERDDFVLGPREGEVSDYDTLVGFLDRLNSEWVTACRRLSPRLLIEWLEWTEAGLAETLAGLEPDGPARFPVSWAGEEASKCWFDVARELTERWLHQQQIRLAVGAAPLREPNLSRVVFDTLLRALPHGYREVDGQGSEVLEVRIQGAESFDYCLSFGPDRWRLMQGRAEEPTAAIHLDEEPAWLLLSKGRPGDVVRSEAETEGPERLIRPFFEVVAVMA